MATFTIAGMYRGARDMFSLSFFVVLFGIAFGVAAKAVGMSDMSAAIMSATLFAGAAQFAILEVWGEQIPLLPLFAITFAVNARYILTGAALYPWLKTLPPHIYYPSLAVMSDANFAMSHQANKKGEKDFGYFFGSGAILWFFWLFGTFVGSNFGTLVGDPSNYALDAVMPAFFTALLAISWEGNKTLFPWVAAAAVSLIAYTYLPANWNIILGALAGGIVGAFAKND